LEALRPCPRGVVPPAHTERRSMRAKLIPALLLTLAATTTAAYAQRQPVCRPDNAGLKLQPGFCALIVADSVGQARHLVVAPDGDIYVSVAGSTGGVLALRDTSGDGVADVRERFGPGRGGAGIALRGDQLYFATNDAILRYK